MRFVKLLLKSLARFLACLIVGLEDIQCQEFSYQTPSLWEISDGILRLASPGARDEIALFSKDARDVILRMKARSVSKLNYFIVLGFQRTTTFDSYYFQFRDNAVNLYLAGAKIASDDFDLVTDRDWHWIEVGRSGDEIFAKFAGRSLSVTDTRFMTGRIGFGSFRGTADFDSVSVTYDGQTKFFDFEETTPIVEFTPLHSDTVLVSWDENQESDLKNYTLYLTNEETKEQRNPINAPKSQTSWWLFGHEKNQIYRLSVTASDSAGNESRHSLPVFYKVVAASSDSVVQDTLWVEACDLNQDGILDGRDASIFYFSLWAEEGDSLYFEPADIVRDGRIDGKDLSVCQMLWNKGVLKKK